MTDQTKKVNAEGVEMVEIEKISLDNILARLQALEGSKVASTIPKSVRNAKKTARVRFVDNDSKLVVGYKKSFDVINKEGNHVLMMQVVGMDKNGKTAVYEVPFVEWNQAGLQVEAEITNIDRKVVEINQGVANVIKVDYDKFKSEDTGRVVDMIATTHNTTFKLKLPKDIDAYSGYEDYNKLWAGEEVEISELAIN